MNKITAILAAFICAISIIFGAWILASWCDIVADNCSPNPIHSEHNFFVIMFEKSVDNKSIL